MLSRYKDSVGVWTIAAGITDNAGVSIRPSTYTGTLTVPQAMDLFAEALKKYEDRVRRRFAGFTLTQAEFDAAVSFDYNTGGIFKASWVDAVKRGDRVDARRRFMLWNKPPEIKGRRTKEMDLFFEGEYSNNGTVPVYKATSAGRVIWGSRKSVPVDVLTGPIAGLDKPAGKSSTNTAVTLTGAAGAVGTATSALGGLNPWVAGVLILVVAAGVFWVIKERKKYRDAFRNLLP